MLHTVSSNSFCLAPFMTPIFNHFFFHFQVLIWSHHVVGFCEASVKTANIMQQHDIASCLSKPTQDEKVRTCVREVVFVFGENMQDVIGV